MCRIQQCDKYLPAIDYMGILSRLFVLIPYWVQKQTCTRSNRWQIIFQLYNIWVFTQGGFLSWSRIRFQTQTCTLVCIWSNRWQMSSCNILYVSSFKEFCVLISLLGSKHRPVRWYVDGRTYPTYLPAIHYMALLSRFLCWSPIR